MAKKGFEKYDVEKIKSLCDGFRSSREIADIVGCPVKYVQAKMKSLDLPRMSRGALVGSKNHSYKVGRVIDRDGYALVQAPLNHPYARKKKHRNYGIILEHRLVVEKSIGRYLEPNEVVDHVDGLHLHNHPSNLRVFDKNASHLKETLVGKKPRWTKQGYQNMKTPMSQRSTLERVDTYNHRKKLGEVRLRQILLLWLSHGKDSVYLLGTHMYLEQAQIDWSKHCEIEQALRSLLLKWEQDLY